MGLKVVFTAFAAVAALGLLAGPAAAAPKKTPKVVDARGHTVVITRDEDGKTHTRIIIQKRSYLDPGTESLPSDRNTLDYMQNPGQHATSVLDNTAFGGNQSALPGAFTLSGQHNPWLQF
jgi:hypothetical protein